MRAGIRQVQRHGDRAVDFVLTRRGSARVVSEEQWMRESTIEPERALMEYEYLRTHWDAYGMIFEPRSDRAP